MGSNNRLINLTRTEAGSSNGPAFLLAIPPPLFTLHSWILLLDLNRKGGVHHEEKRWEIKSEKSKSGYADSG
jgi:hypothetical protein